MSHDCTTTMTTGRALGLAADLRNEADVAGCMRDATAAFDCLNARITELHEENA